MDMIRLVYIPILYIYIYIYVYIVYTVQLMLMFTVQLMYSKNLAFGTFMSYCWLIYSRKFLLNHLYSSCDYKEDYLKRL